MPIRRRREFAAALATACLIAAATAHAGPTPVQKCQATKNKTAGQYAACRQNAEAKLTTSGDAVKYAAALTKCGTKFATAWLKAIAKAAKVNASCLDDPLTATDFQTVLNQSTDNIATALAGTGLSNCTTDLATCNGSLGTCTTNLETCQAIPPGQRLQTGQTTCYSAAGGAVARPGTGQDGELQKGLVRAYTDNGDGTITDTRTGLVWEKLADDGSLHDKDTTYTWADAFAVKVAGLNAGGGFAGHTDWRLPNVSELQSLLNYGAASPAVSPVFNTACAGGCTVTTCSCTQSSRYWTSTAYQAVPTFAWLVDFSDGDSFQDFKPTGLYVRGVRDGS